MIQIHVDAKYADFFILSGIYISITIALTACSLVLAVILLSVHHNSMNGLVPKYVKKIADFCAKLTFMTVSWSHQLEDNQLVESRFSTYQSGYPIRADLDQGRLQREDDGCYQKASAEKNIIMTKILENVEELCLIQERIREFTRRKRDWVQVACIFDRFLLVLFLQFNVISTFVLFVIFPLLKPDKSHVY